ncbi:MAG: DUF3386 family protein [Gemmataceae bacterium]|nr:DUF3386 family protein [Gemmataceae bacterium]
MLRHFLPAVLISVVFTSLAKAHFLFVRILPPAEGGRFAEVYFSELAEAGDPRFIAKIAHTELWLQTTPGKFEPLKVHTTPDRLRAHVPTSGTLCVVGACTYGVLGREKQTPFLLRHYPKALAGEHEELNKLQPLGKLPLEVVATFTKDEVRFMALMDGKPMPGAEFVTVDASLANTKLVANDKGEASWKPSVPGVYAVYTRNTRKQGGEHAGKKYDEIREFATVAFTWPLTRDDVDAAAVALFEEAIAARAQWQASPGFQAKIKGNLAGRPFVGPVSIDDKGEVSFLDDDSNRQESVSTWIEDQLASIAMHRLPSVAKSAKPAIRFAEGKAEDPLGRLLLLDGGKFASSYRVKDKQIVVVNRHLGKENMTITVLENDKNAQGRFLPRSYLVQYWDAVTGRLLRTETVQTRWERVSDWDLPTHHQVISASDAGILVRTMTLSKHELLKAK